MDRPERLVPIQPLNSQKMERYTSGSDPQVQPAVDGVSSAEKNRPTLQKDAKQSEQAKRTKMQNLLTRMSERYKNRIESTDSSLSTDQEEMEKTKKLKAMIEILQNKLNKYEDKSSSRRFDEQMESTTPKSFRRATQRTRTTPSRDKLDNEEKLIDVTLGNSVTPSPNEAWQSAMDTLSSKISHMGSGIHRLDLDKILDLDLLPMPPGEDQKTSNSYTATSAVPPGVYGGQANKNLPKRQALHPKLTYQRPDLRDVHRPSINIKKLIKPIEDYNPPANTVKKLPLIPRYTDEEVVIDVSDVTMNGHQCPYIPKRPIHECISAPPDECSAPGYTGRECPVGTICCYDGCINLCWEPPYVSSTVAPFVSTPTVAYIPETSTVSPGLSEPLFYSPAPEDFKPEVRPHPLHGQYEHSKEYVSSNAYRTTSRPKPSHHTSSAKPPAFNYKPPSLDYLPPLENKDIHYHDPQSIREPVHDPKSLEPKEPSTMYPPPSLEYKEPSIKFVQKPISRGLPEVPPYQNYYPPPHYSTTPSTVTSYESTSMTSLKPPALDYLPPKKAKALDHSTAKMQAYIPPDKNYLPPTRTINHMQEYHPPTNEYLPPKPDYMSKMTPPVKSYQPPQSDISHMKTYQTPNREYLPPTLEKESSQKYHPPSKEYLPPPSTTQKPHHMVSYSPPTKSYLPPNPSTLHTTMTPPVLKYSEPTVSAKYREKTVPTKTYLPPNKGYIPPAKLMLQTIHKGTPQPPAQRNPSLQPHLTSTYSPPVKQYLPPETTAAYKSTDSPSYGNPTPVLHISTTMKVPSKDYIPPVKPTYKTTEVKGDIHHTESPLHMSTYQPPSKSYLPPSHPTKIPHQVTISYEPQQKKIPHEMIHMHPPTKQYKQPVAYCPSVEPISKEHCPHVTFQCWHPGKPDADCPHNGLCCFDGCYNVCLDPHQHPYKGPFHKPNHIAHILPSHEYVPKEVVEHDHTSSHVPHGELVSFHHRTLATKPHEPAHLHPASAPMHEMEKVYALGELPVPVAEVKQQYSPPSKSYLPPENEQHHLHHVEESMKHMKPPTYEPVSVKLPTAYEDVFPTPNLNLPGTPTYEKKEHLHPPSKEYLPPPESYLKEAGHVKISPPNKEYLPPKTEGYKEQRLLLPPSKSYLPPTIHHDHMKPPTEEYHSPKPTTFHMKPPVEEYHPPIVDPTYSSHELIHPPTKEYLPPVKPEYEVHELFQPEHHIGQDYMKPPTKEYLPPHYTKVEHIQPPTKDYLPPVKEAKYTSPKLPLGPEYIKPPTKEYLPPKPIHHHPTHDHILPPTKEYLPPNPVKHHSQGHAPVKPVEHYAGPTHIEPPTKEYLPPKHEPTPSHILPALPHHATLDHIKPPSKEYLPPSSVISHPIAEFSLPHGNIEPPHKEYLPPPSDYVPKAVSVLLQSEKASVLKPPSKDYLPPPKGTVVIPKDPPVLFSTTVSPHGLIEPPTKEYLPPVKGHHVIEKEPIHSHEIITPVGPIGKIIPTPETSGVYKPGSEHFVATYSNGHHGKYELFSK